MSSSYSENQNQRGHRGSAQEYYEPERQFGRGFADSDGYAPRDRYDALPPIDDLNTNPNLLPRSPSHRSFNEGSYGAPGYENPRGSLSAGQSVRRSSRHRSHGSRDHDDGDYDSESSDERSRRGRDNPVAKLKRRVSKVFDSEDKDDGDGNTAAKKWGATLAGAVVGGLAGRQAKREHWVPAALGAVLGGLTAREAEKIYYHKREEHAKERDAWGGRRRSRSSGY